MSDIDQDPVERYLACLAAHDWSGLAATIADEGLTRDGPFCDRVEGKQRYVEFLRGLMPTLKGYRLNLHRLSKVSDRRAYVELSETFEMGGVVTEYPECILFEWNEDGLIDHVSVFIKQPGGEATVEGGRAGYSESGDSRGP